MNCSLTSTQNALQSFFACLNTLRDEGILINKKDFTCQIGEWLVASIYGGERAVNAIQKGWDIDINGKHIQVKTHAKAAHNKARWSAVDCSTDELVDELVIVVFTFDYKLKEFFKVPWEEAKRAVKQRGKKKPRWEITWKSVTQYKQHIDELPRQNIIQLFR